MSTVHIIKHEGAAEMLIKHKLKPSSLLASRQHDECFILQCLARLPFVKYMLHLSKLLL